MAGGRRDVIRERIQEVFAEFPLIAIRTRSDHSRLRLEDGSHRAIAYYLAGFRQAFAYVARVPSAEQPDMEVGRGRRRETGDRRQESGDRRQGTGGQEAGDRRQGTGDRRQGTGDRSEQPDLEVARVKESTPHGPG